MDEIPLSAQLSLLAVLLVVSGFFAMAETAMMACNRYRLRASAQGGHSGARAAVALLAKTDKLLGVILLFNTLINAAIAMLAGLVTVQLFGEEKWVLGVGTLVVSFAILVFAEITPKVIGASYPDRVTPWAALLLAPILRLTDPIISAVNLLVLGMLKLARLSSSGSHHEKSLSPDELRAIVLESSHGVPSQHRDILLNLFELEDITVDDIMTPRGDIETIDIQASLDEIREQLATSYHTRLPVHDGDLANTVGILHQRRLLASALTDDWDHETLKAQLVEPYFIPSGTRVYTQIQFFRENRQRMGLVVDEYGEILGLLTLEDIIEEIIGKFTTSMPGNDRCVGWEQDGTAMVDGARPLRELNRTLALDFPLDGPKTLNGLILEHFQDIPEAGVSAKIANVPMEIIQTQDRVVRRVKLFRPET